MVEAEFGFLEMGVKCPLGHAVEFGEPAFGIAPEVSLYFLAKWIS